MTGRHVQHMFHTASVREKVTKCKTKLETLEGSGDGQQVCLYKKTIAYILKYRSLAKYESLWRTSLPSTEQ